MADTFPKRTFLCSSGEYTSIDTVCCISLAQNDEDLNQNRLSFRFSSTGAEAARSNFLSVPLNIFGSDPSGETTPYDCRSRSPECCGSIESITLSDDSSSSSHSVRTPSEESTPSSSTGTSPETSSRRVRDEISIEFENIPLRLSSCSIGSSPKNSPKNRYSDVIPCDDHLVEVENVPYINASLVALSCEQKPKNHIIACQAPIDTTVNDFWMMIFEKKPPVILMLTNLVEKFIPKCVLYWPNVVGKSITCGTVTVECIEIDETYNVSFILITTFRVSDSLLSSFTTKHVHFTGWPDRGVPEVNHFSLLVEIVDDLWNEASETPIVAHCSAGIGRTGTFAAIVSYKREKREISEIVKNLRQCRPGMVQSESQYRFIHEVIGNA